MVAISKQLFYEKIDRNVKCWELFHPWTQNCLKAHLIAGICIFIGGMRFFIPLHIVKAIIEYKKINGRKYAVKWIKDLIRSACYGVAFGTPILFLNCLFCHLFGLHYYIVGLLVGTLAGTGLLVETYRNRMLDTLLLSNLVVEAVLRNLHHFNIFELTIKNQTLLFMAFSSCLMYLMKNREGKISITHFWFYVPDKIQNAETRIEEDPKKNCVHSGNCIDFLTKGASKYFAVGYVISIIKNFLGKFEKLIFKPTLLVNILVNRNNVLFGLFTAIYVAVYRYFSCYLLNKYGTDRPVFGAVAGLLAGITYAIKPDIQFLVLSIVTTLQMLYERLKTKCNIPSQIPVRQMVFMISNGILLHNRLYLPETCPKYYHLLLSSGNLIDDVYSSIIKRFLGT